MPFFENPGSVHIAGTTLIDVQGNQFIHYNEVTASDAGITRLLEATAVEAFYNSAERFPPPKCHPETRRLILSRIMTWGRALKDESPLTAPIRILWLWGPAGAGKSAISQTLSEEFSKSGILAASFFFARGKDRRGSAEHFVATIVYQLSISIPIIRDLVGTIIARDPSVLRQSLDFQFQKLIIDPLISVFRGVPKISRQQPFLIIIDGLDECDSERHQQAILYNAAAIIYKHHLPLAFLFTSRPDALIQDCFQQNWFFDPPDQLFLGSSNRDVLVFLESGFQEVRHHHEIMAAVPEPWPSAGDMAKLLYKSSGHFIYASTVLKFIGDENANPIERLALVLSGELAPLAELDELYQQILSTASNRALLRRILGCILASNQQLTLSMIDALLGISPGESRLALRKMRPLLDFSDEHVQINIIHGSFCSFLRDPQRAGDLYIDTYLSRSEISRAGIKYVNGWGMYFPSMARVYMDQVLPFRPHRRALSPFPNIFKDPFQKTYDSLVGELFPSSRSVADKMKLVVILVGFNDPSVFNILEKFGFSSRPRHRSSLKGFGYREYTANQFIRSDPCITILVASETEPWSESSKQADLLISIMKVFPAEQSETAVYRLLYGGYRDVWAHLKGKLGPSKIFGNLDTRWVPEPHEFQYWEFLHNQWSHIKKWEDLDLDILAKTALFDWIDTSNAQYESSLKNDLFGLMAHFEGKQTPSHNNLFTQLQDLVLRQRQVLQELRLEASTRNESSNLSVQYSLAHKYGCLGTELVPVFRKLLRLRIPLGPHLAHTISRSLQRK